jgi:hypothetical protein
MLEAPPILGSHDFFQGGDEFGSWRFYTSISVLSAKGKNSAKENAIESNDLLDEIENLGSFGFRLRLLRTIGFEVDSDFFPSFVVSFFACFRLSLSFARSFCRLPVCEVRQLSFVLNRVAPFCRCHAQRSNFF